MNKIDFGAIARTVQSTMVRKSPEILTGIGIAGMIATTVMAVRATPKATRLLEEAKKRKEGEKLTTAEVVKTTWKCYIPAAVTCLTSAACLIGANSVNVRRNAAIATAYNLSQTALTEYKDKVKETVGEVKERAVRNAIAQDKVDRDPVSNHDVVVTDRGTSLFKDGMFGRYFISDMETVDRAMNWVNRNITSSMYISLNEFYGQIGLSHIDAGYDLGWNIDDGEIELIRSTAVASDGRPCHVITYNVMPKYDFNRLF